MESIKHPGKLIRAAMRGSKVRQVKLAQDIPIAPSALSETLSGKRPVTPAICLALERAGIGNAEDWLWMAMRHELAQERSKQSPSPQL